MFELCLKVLFTKRLLATIIIKKYFFLNPITWFPFSNDRDILPKYMSGYQVKLHSLAPTWDIDFIDHIIIIIKMPYKL